MNTLFAVIVSSLVVLSQPILQPVAQPVDGYIYLGDSRFVGMDSACSISEEENTWVVAEVGKGLSWCKDTAMSEIEQIISDNSEIDEWYIVSGLGVNDSGNAGKYLDFYEGLSEDYNLILLTVNPMEQSRCARYGYKYQTLQSGADTMNEKLLDSDFTVIDTAGYLKENGFSTTDGVHYTKSTYESLWEFMQDELCGIMEKEQELKILTERDDTYVQGEDQKLDDRRKRWRIR